MKRNFSRRAFLQGSAAATGGALVSKTILLNAQPFGPAKPVPASDRVRFGMIGVGMQGSGLLAGAITIPGIECVAAADLYDGRHTLAKEITANPSESQAQAVKGLFPISLPSMQVHQWCSWQNQPGKCTRNAKVYQLASYPIAALQLNSSSSRAMAVITTSTVTIMECV